MNNIHQEIQEAYINGFMVASWSGDLDTAKYRAEKYLSDILSKREITPWNPVFTIPKNGIFLICVWESHCEDEEKHFHVYEANGSPNGPIWKKEYKTDKCGSYKIAGWMPIHVPEFKCDISDLRNILENKI